MDWEQTQSHCLEPATRTPPLGSAWHVMHSLTLMAAPCSDVVPPGQSPDTRLMGSSHMPDGFTPVTVCLFVRMLHAVRRLFRAATSTLHSQRQLVLSPTERPSVIHRSS